MFNRWASRWVICVNVMIIINCHLINRIFELKLFAPCSASRWGAAAAHCRPSCALRRRAWCTRRRGLRRGTCAPSPPSTPQGRTSRNTNCECDRHWKEFDAWCCGPLLAINFLFHVLPATAAAPSPATGSCLTTRRPPPPGGQRWGRRGICFRRREESENKICNHKM